MVRVRMCQKKVGSKGHLRILKKAVENGIDWVILVPKGQREQNWLVAWYSEPITSHREKAERYGAWNVKYVQLNWMTWHEEWWRG